MNGIIDNTERADIEAAINADLPTDRQVAFDRREDGRLLPWGFVPMQAWGAIGPDRLRFYFRFRSNHAHLTIYEPGSQEDRDARTTAGHSGVYSGVDADVAGMFETGQDMVDCFVELVLAQRPVDAAENPTNVQRMETALIFAMMARHDGDMAAQEQGLLDQLDSEVARVIHQRWLTSPDVAAWVARGRTPTKA